MVTELVSNKMSLGPRCTWQENQQAPCLATLSPAEVQATGSPIAVAPPYGPPPETLLGVSQVITIFIRILKCYLPFFTFIFSLEGRSCELDEECCAWLLAMHAHLRKQINASLNEQTVTVHILETRYMSVEMNQLLNKYVK